jgi:hypothetical protein
MIHPIRKEGTMKINLTNLNKDIDEYEDLSNSLFQGEACSKTINMKQGGLNGRCINLR